MLVDRGPVTAAALAALALLGGCGGGTEQANGAAPPNAQSVPGLDVVERPEAPAAPAQVAREVATVEHAGLLPDRARIVSREPMTGAIAFDFHAPDTVARVAAWYRAGQTRGGFVVTSELQEGAEHVLSGITRQPAGDFSVRLAADEGGGTTAMVLVTLRR